jgi:hypothetical protein
MWQDRDNDGATCGEGTCGRVLSFGNDDNDDLGHGCKVMLHLLWLWTSAKCRIICTDSYFASAQAARCLFDLNFRFIGVIKTATKLFPKSRWSCPFVGLWEH